MHCSGASRQRIENVKFYTEKCGFKIVSKEKDGNVELARFVMERS